MPIFTVRPGIYLSPTDDPVTATQRWHRDGVEIPGAIGTSYTTVSPADDGALIEYVEIAGNFAGDAPEQRLTLQSVPIDSDATAYITAVETADGATLEDDVKAAINSFFISLKRDSLWASITSACIMSGARTVAGCLVPIKGLAPVNFNSNFVSGDYNRKTGLKGNGTTKRLNTQYTGDDFAQNNVHISIYRTAADTVNVTTGLMGDGVLDSGTLGLTMFSRGYDGRCQSSTRVHYNATEDLNGLGFYGISRAESSQYTARAAGVSSTVADTSQPPFTGEIIVFGRNGAATTDSRMTWYSLGTSINLGLLDASLETLMANLDAAIL